MEEYCLVVVRLIWEFLHLCDVSYWVGTKICICFWTSETTVGSWPVYKHYELLVVMVIDIYLRRLLPQIAPYSNWGHKIMFPSLAGFCLFAWVFFSCFTGSPLDLLWSFNRFFSHLFNLFPCNHGCLLIVPWRNMNHWPIGEFYYYQSLLLLICDH